MSKAEISSIEGQTQRSQLAPAWSEAGGRRIVFLLDASSATERRLLENWVEQNFSAKVNGAFDLVRIPASRRRRRNDRADPRLEACLAGDDDPLLAPLRVAWNPDEQSTPRNKRLRTLLLTGDARDPGRLRQAWILRRSPQRCRVVVAEPAPLSELRKRWRTACSAGSEQTLGLAEFVIHQAQLALERAERRLRGARYKVPRFVYESILSRPAFRAGIQKLARELGRSELEVGRDAARYLREIAATHSTYVIDLVARITHLLYTRAYGDTLHYDRGQLEKIYALAQRYPVVFLPTHRSNLDHLVLTYMLYENGHPPNHTAGGINMNFFPVGLLVRRTGVFFIRRTFKDNATYKFVLRQYIDYLIEKRFPLEWYIEGGRSRSGKMLPPRFGLLAYVVDAYRRGKSEDVILIPVSIAYDQIQDVGEYVAEQRGARKERESFRWLLKVIRRLSRNYGKIHIRFGEPLSLQRTLGPAQPGAEPANDEQNLTLQKIAFEVCVRINRATPITPVSLLTLALLGAGDQALTVEEIQRSLVNLLHYVHRRSLPTTGPLDLDTEAGIRRALDTLIRSGVVTCFAKGPEPVYMIGPDQHLTAAYYRNTIIHFFVNGAIAELALLRAAEEDVIDPLTEFWNEALRLRDLLKFEFFFAEKEIFRAELHEEIALHEPEWDTLVRAGGSEIQLLVRRIRPFNSHRVLRPFLEAYRVVFDLLERRDPASALEETPFLDQCLALGRQYLLQRRIRSAESVSKVLFSTALSLAKNRGLITPGDSALAERRKSFARDLRQIIRRIDAIDALAAARRAGLIE